MSVSLSIISRGSVGSSQIEAYFLVCYYNQNIRLENFMAVLNVFSDMTPSSLVGSINVPEELTAAIFR